MVKFLTRFSTFSPLSFRDHRLQLFRSHGVSSAECIWVFASCVLFYVSYMFFLVRSSGSERSSRGMLVIGVHRTSMTRISFALCVGCSYSLPGRTRSLESTALLHVCVACSPFFVCGRNSSFTLEMVGYRPLLLIPLPRSQDDNSRPFTTSLLPAVCQL
jgi:hypothetical protein